MVRRDETKMLAKKSLGEAVFDTLNYALLAVLLVVTLYPCLYIAIASISDPVLLHAGSKILLWPRGFSINTYKIVFSNLIIWISYKNTIIYMILGTVINLTVTTSGAYVLSRAYLPGRIPVLLGIVFTMYFSGGMIPTYLLVKNLGMLDTLWAMVLPSAVNSFNLIIMITYFKTIPDSMEESAKMDGANELRILLFIMIPLAIPVIAVIALYYMVAHWNSFIPPLLYLNTREKFPLQIILREILIQNDAAASNGVLQAGGSVADYEAYAENVKYATIIVATVPILLVYPFLQRFFVKGIMIGAIKE